MIFSERLKELRTEKGVKQKDVAEFIVEVITVPGITGVYSKKTVSIMFKSSRCPRTIITRR